MNTFEIRSAEVEIKSFKSLFIIEVECIYLDITHFKEVNNELATIEKSSKILIQNTVTTYTTIIFYFHDSFAFILNGTMLYILLKTLMYSVI